NQRLLSSYDEKSDEASRVRQVPQVLGRREGTYGVLPLGRTKQGSTHQGSQGSTQPLARRNARSVGSRLTLSAVFWSRSVLVSLARAGCRATYSLLRWTSWFPHLARPRTNFHSIRGRVS